MTKMWAGRTSGVTDSIADDFNSSIRFDCKLYKQDITGSMAHAAMLGAKGILSQKEAGQLIDGLQGILEDLESGKLEFDLSCEDIHMFVEQELTARLGDVGKKLHTARSRIATFHQGISRDTSQLIGKCLAIRTFIVDEHLHTMITV